MSQCIGETEILVLLEELKRIGIYVNKSAVSVVVKRVENDESIIYTILTQSATIQVLVTSKGIEKAMVFAAENKYIAGHYKHNTPEQH